MREKITFNCSGTKSSARKVWTFEIENHEEPDCTSMHYAVSVHESKSFPDDSKAFASALEHVDQAMRPIIHESDENLRQLSPEQ